MYTKILVAIENSAADRAVLQHVEGLVSLTGAELLLVHVADGFAARHFDDLELRGLRVRAWSRATHRHRRHIPGGCPR